MNFSIQSMSDIITNSSSEVFTLYGLHHKKLIKNIVNAILAINSNYTFDDLFEIKLGTNEYAVEWVWDNNTDLQERFPNIENFFDHIEQASDDDLEFYEEQWYDSNYAYESGTFFDGYWVTLKPGIEVTDQIQAAVNAINSFDTLFDHEVSYS